MRSDVVALLEQAGHFIGTKDDRQHAIGLTFERRSYSVQDGRIVRTVN
jgi:hypothetical protein